MNIKTILFDMDGIIIDSEKLHIKSTDLALKNFGIEIAEEKIVEFVGRSDESFFEYIYNEVDNSNSEEDMLKEKARHYDIIVKDLQYIDGFESFIDKVKTNSITTGMVTSSTYIAIGKADKILDHMKHFDIIVAEEDTNKHKPFPEPYLLGLEKTKAVAGNTLVIEDSINGIKSGKEAGCIVAGLTTSFNKEILLEAGADMVFDTYEELAEHIFKN